jgi:thiamine-monophosphate kinase
MPLSEFDLIARYFRSAGPGRADVALGVGDDCALLRVPPGSLLAVSIDTLVAGVHFPVDTAAADLGHKALAVNLSDLAAIGAEPAWATLALTLPEADEAWLVQFSAAFQGLAARFGVELVGGDTTRGPLSITVQAHGFVPEAGALRRAGARPGDLIYVTGELGDAGLALLALQQELQLPAADRVAVLQRLYRPAPRIAAGIALRAVASAAIDVSDGLAADLGHILAASGVGATLQVERLPISPVLARHFHAAGGWVLPLGAGDDYELCFTVPAVHQGLAEQALEAAGCPCTWIGLVEARPGLRCLLDDGTDLGLAGAGYQHFGG